MPSHAVGLEAVDEGDRGPVANGDGGDERALEASRREAGLAHRLGVGGGLDAEWCRHAVDREFDRITQRLALGLAVPCEFVG